MFWTILGCAGAAAGPFPVPHSGKASGGLQQTGKDSWLSKSGQKASNLSNILSRSMIMLEAMPQSGLGSERHFGDDIGKCQPSEEVERRMSSKVNFESTASRHTHSD